MSTKVFRVVVDSYPTPDGKPFIDQPDEFWEEIVDHHYNPTEPDPTPDWVPAIDEYLWTTDNGPFGNSFEPPVRRGAPVSQDERGYPLLVVPALTRKHFFARHAAKTRVDQLIEWGCVARVETAEIGEWK